MFDIDRWREIFQAISKNKLRTVLTGFTISFAILLFTLLFGLGNGLKNTFTKQFAGDAENVIYIKRGKTSKAYKGLQAGRRIKFKNDDYTFLIDKFSSDIQYITPIYSKFLIANYKDEKSRYQVRGTTSDIQFIEELVIQKGRFLKRFDIKQNKKIVVIGRLVEKDLFGKRSALNKLISIGGFNYRVVGVFSDPGGDNDERYLYMPISTMQAIFGSTDEVDRFRLTFRPDMSNAEAIAFGKKINKELKLKHDVHQRDQSAILIQNMAEAKQQVGGMMLVLTFITLIIGLGTLIAGVIGVSNIMVFVVRERTKELGIRKALGATPSSIIGMILQEALLITAIAGYSGLLLGVAILDYMTPSLKDFFITDPSVSNTLIVGATVTLIISGLIAGYLPARRAARIKPIDALNAS
jgi:putative ABC transport system permease protein